MRFRISRSTPVLSMTHACCYLQSLGMKQVVYLYGRGLTSTLPPCHRCRRSAVGPTTALCSSRGHVSVTKSTLERVMGTLDSSLLTSRGGTTSAEISSRRTALRNTDQLLIPGQSRFERQTLEQTQRYHRLPASEDRNACYVGNAVLSDIAAEVGKTSVSSTWRTRIRVHIPQFAWPWLWVSTGFRSHCVPPPFSLLREKLQSRGCVAQDPYSCEIRCDAAGGNEASRIPTNRIQRQHAASYGAPSRPKFLYKGAHSRPPHLPRLATPPHVLD